MLTYLIRTNSLDSDERFDKTLEFLIDCGQEVQVFGVVKSVSIRSNEFVQKQLRMRSRFPSGNLVLLKYLELIVITFWYLACTRGRRWYANFDFLPLQFFSTLFACSRNRPIWDLHEMPPNFVVRNMVLRQVFAYMLANSHVIVCNEARRDALEEAFGVSLRSALVLRNYPGKKTYRALVEARQDYLSKTSAREDILSILIVGGNLPGRYVIESIEAITELRRETGYDIRIKLVGGAPIDTSHDFVTSTGFIPFHQLIEECVKGGITLCFYRMSTLNNVLCEPNRFYQGLLAGQQVLTFAHPSLEQIVSPQRHIVDERQFCESLQNTLKGLFEELLISKSGPPSIVESTTSDFIFEGQLPAFARWIPR